MFISVSWCIMVVRAPKLEKEVRNNNTVLKRWEIQCVLLFFYPPFFIRKSRNLLFSSGKFAGNSKPSKRERTSNTKIVRIINDLFNQNSPILAVSVTFRQYNVQVEWLIRDPNVLQSIDALMQQEPVLRSVIRDGCILPSIYSRRDDIYMLSQESVNIPPSKKKQR